jgi:hypothetical protein
MLALRR